MVGNNELDPYWISDSSTSASLLISVNSSLFIDWFNEFELVSTWNPIQNSLMINLINRNNFNEEIDINWMKENAVELWNRREEDEWDVDTFLVIEWH